jgi:hypothetical protein
MCRPVPYLSVKVFIHPPQDHLCVSWLKRGCDFRQTSGPATLAEADVDGDMPREGKGDNPAKDLW